MSCGATVGASAANSNLIEFKKNNFYPCLKLLIITITVLVTFYL